MESEKILKQLLRMVNAPFSEYKDTYNKLCDAKDSVRVDMNEDSKEATIVENALIVAGISGRLKADIVLNLLENITAIDVKQGKIGLAYRTKGGVPWPEGSILIHNIRI